MNILILLLYIGLILLDCILLVELRKLVYSFLLSKRNIRGAKKIHKSQLMIDKITLAYISDHTIYKKQFCFFQRLWVVNMFGIVPQYIMILTINIFWPNIVAIILLIFVGIKILMNFIVRNNFNSNRISKFDKRY